MTKNEDSGALFGLLRAAHDAGTHQAASEAVEDLVANGVQSDGPRQIAGHTDPLLTAKFLSECSAEAASEATRVAAARWGSTLPDVIALHLARALDGAVPGVSRSQVMRLVKRYVREDLQQDVVLARTTNTIDMVAWQILAYANLADVERVLEKLMCGDMHLAHTSGMLFDRGETLVTLALSAAGGGNTGYVYRQWSIEELAVVARWATKDGVVERVARAARGVAVESPDAETYSIRADSYPMVPYMHEAMMRCQENSWPNMREELGRRASFSSLTTWAVLATTSELERWADCASARKTATTLESVFSFDNEVPALCDAVCRRCRGIAGLMFAGDHATGYAIGRTLAKWCKARSDWQLALALAPEWSGTVEELGRAVSSLACEQTQN
jgi:hypothetical protein